MIFTPLFVDEFSRNKHSHKKSIWFRLSLWIAIIWIGDGMRARVGVRCKKRQNIIDCVEQWQKVVIKSWAFEWHSWLVAFFLSALFHLPIEHLLMHCQLDNDATNESWCKEKHTHSVDFPSRFWIMRPIKCKSLTNNGVLSFHPMFLSESSWNKRKKKSGRNERLDIFSESLCAHWTAFAVWFFCLSSLRVFAHSFYFHCFCLLIALDVRESRHLEKRVWN